MELLNVNQASVLTRLAHSTLIAFAGEGLTNYGTEIEPKFSREELEIIKNELHIPELYGGMSVEHKKLELKLEEIKE